MPGGRTELALGNLPFPHTIDWRAISLFLVPRRTRLSDREAPADGARVQCRAEEATWLARIHANHSLLERMRADGRRAFEAALDIEFHPEGVVGAFLAELVHVLRETPAISWRTHPLTVASMDAQAVDDLNLVMPPKHYLRRPTWATQESPWLSQFRGDEDLHLGTVETAVSPRSLVASRQQVSIG